ncbi:hypothetical protein H312_00902 [Anncaliia algerae PRA339]|uniref:Uncharacterized protein n=1 Tax=Anncaliia algerae PRA339 TaxID=1288291 RepID=A0A059F371_9MICR|nr:hypothetical protein H312_00902 [Anncaliia algerae PRA339]
MEEQAKLTSKIKNYVSSLFRHKKSLEEEVVNKIEENNEPKLNLLEENVKYKQLINDYDTTISYILSENENKEIDALKSRNSELLELNNALKSDLQMATEKANFFKMFAKNKLQEEIDNRNSESIYFKERINELNQKIEEFKKFLNKNSKDKEIIECFNKLFN